MYMSKDFVNAGRLSIRDVSSLSVAKELLTLSKSPSQRFGTVKAKGSLSSKPLFIEFRRGKKDREWALPPECRNYLRA